MLTSVLPRYKGDATPSFVLNLAIQLVKQGVMVRVLAPFGEGSTWREETGGVEIVRFPYVWPLRLSKLCYEGGMLINLRKRPWTKLLLPLFLAAEFVATTWAIIRYKPDIVHSHSLLPQGLVGAVLARLFGLPHLVTSHGNDVFGLKKTGLMGWLKRRALRGACRVTVNSRATRDAVLELGCESSKVVLIPAMPNAARIDSDQVLRLRRQWGEGAEVVLFAGRIIEEKGVGLLIEACVRLMKSRGGLILVVVGEGPDRERFEASARECPFADRIHFCGWVDRSQICTWMAAVDIVAVPSKPGPDGWLEAQGLVAVEAMAVGTLVVASDLGGLTDMILDGETGYLFEAGSEDSLAIALSKALVDPRTSEIRVSAQKRYEAMFSEVAVLRSTIGTYRILLS